MFSEMHRFAWLYPVVAVSGVSFWIAMNSPITALLPGGGDIAVGTGFAILCVSLIQLSLWPASGVRKSTITTIGRTASYLSVVSLGLFCAYSIFLLLNLYIGGI
jgi:hypothetical protein